MNFSGLTQYKERIRIKILTVMFVNSGTIEVRRYYNDGKKRVLYFNPDDMTDASCNRLEHIIKSGTPVLDKYLGNLIEIFLFPNWNADYEDYLQRYYAYGDINAAPLSFHEFEKARERWENEYNVAWEKKDFAKVQELETLLCV